MTLACVSFRGARPKIVLNRIEHRSKPSECPICFVYLFSIQKAKVYGGHPLRTLRRISGGRLGPPNATVYYCDIHHIVQYIAVPVGKSVQYFQHVSVSTMVSNMIIFTTKEIQSIDHHIIVYLYTYSYIECAKCTIYECTNRMRTRTVHECLQRRRTPRRTRVEGSGAVGCPGRPAPHGFPSFSPSAERSGQPFPRSPVMNTPPGQTCLLIVYFNFTVY